MSSLIPNQADVEPPGAWHWPTGLQETSPNRGMKPIATTESGPKKATPDGLLHGRTEPRWFVALVSSLIALCLVLSVLVWWRLLTELP